MVPLFFKGLAFGFVLAATVGPMWVLCLRRTLAQGTLAGFVSGMGIAAADGIYGAIAAFGLTAVSGFLLAQGFWLGLAGTGFLLWLGVRALLSAPLPLDAVPDAAAPRSLAAAFGSTLALTLANPPTILAFAAIFAGLGLTAGAGYSGASLVVAGVFLGSAAWWVILALAAGRLRGRIGPRLARGINVASGLTILGFAVWQLALVLR
ncbi:MAG: LysE family translocator [Betaproteobacteria bacterium]|nr:MAG: LysE family translocator [Betaproteobacteria bacterium]